MTRKDIIVDNGKESLTDEEFEERLNHAYALGRSSGLEHAAGLLLEKALSYYKANNRECDELASRYRDVSFELIKLSKEARPKETV